MDEPTEEVEQILPKPKEVVFTHYEVVHELPSFDLRTGERLSKRKSVFYERKMYETYMRKSLEDKGYVISSEHKVNI